MTGPTRGLGTSLSILVAVICSWINFYFQAEVIRNSDYSLPLWLEIAGHIFAAIIVYSDIMAHITDPGVML